MNQENCRHPSSERQYICLEAKCLENSEYMLECIPCLQRRHTHTDCLKHIKEIILNAKQRKQGLLEIINGKLQFCEEITKQLNVQKSEMGQALSQWINQQFQGQLEQIDNYKNTLNQQMQTVTNVKLSEEQLRQSIEYRLMDVPLFEKENNYIQQILEQNKSSFKIFFESNFKKMSTNYSQIIIDELPKFQRQQMYSKKIPKSLCTNQGCRGQAMTNFCLENSCLQVDELSLECPRCQTQRHNNVDHRQYYINSEDLWKKQNGLIDELEQLCNSKQHQIEEQSKQLQGIIFECQTMMERKLLSFKDFVIEREKQIVSNLQKLKSSYQKEQFVLYREILMQTDYAVLADIQNLEEGFLYIKKQFTNQYEIEKSLPEQKFQDHWFRGLFVVQGQNMQTENEPQFNSVSKYIQQLIKENEQLKLTNKSREQLFIQFRQLLNELKQKLKQSEGQQLLIEIENKFQGIKEKIITLGVSYSSNQHYLQQKTVDILRLAQSMQQLYLPTRR